MVTAHQEGEDVGRAEDLSRCERDDNLFDKVGLAAQFDETDASFVVLVNLPLSGLRLLAVDWMPLLVL